MGKHAIIIIKNNDNKYLQYYDKVWNSYLFLNCKVSSDSDFNLVKEKIINDLSIDTNDINLELLGEKTHKKFSESAKKEKEYTHYFYRVTLNKPLDNKDFKLNNISYKWLSYSEMLNDERIFKVNSDIIEFVNELDK